MVQKIRSQPFTHKIMNQTNGLDFHFIISNLHEFLNPLLTQVHRIIPFISFIFPILPVSVEIINLIKNLYKTLFNVQERYLVYNVNTVIIIMSHFQFCVFKHTKIRVLFTMCCMCGVAAVSYFFFMAYVPVFIEISIRCECFFLFGLPMIHISFLEYICIFTTITVFQRLQSSITVKLINIRSDDKYFLKCLKCLWTFFILVSFEDKENEYSILS